MCIPKRIFQLLKDAGQELRGNEGRCSSSKRDGLQASAVACLGDRYLLAKNINILLHDILHWGSLGIGANCLYGKVAVEAAPFAEG